MDKNVVPGNEYLFREDWGEGLAGKCCPIPFIVDVESSTIKSISNIPEDVSFGQVEWTPDGSGFICVGWFHLPRKLGITYCSNRRSAIFHFIIEKKQHEIIGEDDKTVHSPRFSPDGSKLVYLEAEVGGPHHKGSRIIVYDWAVKKKKTVVDLVKSASGDDFPGVYCKLLPDRVWSADNKRIVFHSMWRSRQEIVCVDVESGKVNCLSSNIKSCSWQLLDIQNDILLASFSNPNKPPAPAIAHLSSDTEINWVVFEETETINNITWSIIKCTPTEETVHKTYPELDYEAIFIEPTQNVKDGLPLIVWPHGGPHAVFPAAYNLYANMFAQLGFASLLINYRGSEGFGENGINSLPGNIGKNDVSDCQHAMTSISTKINHKKIVVFGGSHGGFLSLHLIGQYPDFYKACVCRNPVVDLSAKVVVTDIPDWNFVESGFDYTLKTLAGPDNLKTMWEKSPIQYIDKMKTPTLVLMGKADLRVPPSQTLLLYNALKTRGVPVRMLCYEDNHALSKVGVEADVFVNTALWFLDHIN